MNKLLNILINFSQKKYFFQMLNKIYLMFFDKKPKLKNEENLKKIDSLKIEAKGDLHIDAHHTVEDIGITLGQAFSKAMGDDRKGIRRYANAFVPLDEALSRVVIDISGRPGLEFDAQFTRARVGEFDVDLIHEFFQGFVNHANVTLHVDNIKGDNSHHQAETIFKAFGRALREAVEIDERVKGTPSTKGSL